jgi:predicted P-loop ATPase
MNFHLNKELIFQHTDSKSIYLKFLGLQDFPNGNISSPFSEDKNPSFKLYKNDTYKCFSTGKQGDVFQFIADLYQLDCKSQFKDILEIIAKEMQIPLSFDCNDNAIPLQYAQKGIAIPLKHNENHCTTQQNCNEIDEIPLQSVDMTIAIPLQYNQKGIAIPLKHNENHCTTQQNCNDIDDLPLQSVDKIIAMPLQCNHIEIATPLEERNENHSTTQQNQNNTDNLPLHSADKTIAMPLQQKNDKVHKIEVEKCEMEERHLTFWKDLGVSKEQLEKYQVNAILSYQFFSIEKNKNFHFKIPNKVIAFGYEVNGNFEVYIPAQPHLNQKKVFNSGLQKEDIFGWKQLEKHTVPNLIICAGKKDTIVLCSRGFYAVTFRSETHYPTQEQIQMLKGKCSNLFICYDNDKGGENGRKAITKQFPEIIPLVLPSNETIKGYDITNYFQDHTTEEFQNIIELALKNITEEKTNEKNKITKAQNLTVIHITEYYLTKHYNLRFNTISLDIEISVKDQNKWKVCNENNLWIELQKARIRISEKTLLAILKSDYVNEYNPIKYYFENLPEWDVKTDHIERYLQYITLNENEDEEQFKYHFKKWCVRAVKGALFKDYFNKQCFVLSDNGIGQNIGKTTWIENLCPPALEDYSNNHLAKDKDGKIALSKNFLINLDELAHLSRQDTNELKSIFSTSKVKVRLPYGKKDVTTRRICSFIGSTNNTTFLTDETGSVRWLCFMISKIDFSYKIDFNIDNLWAQAYYLANDSTFDEVFTREDIIKNEERNEKYQVQTPEKEMILKYFEKPKDKTNAEKMTATDIITFLNQYTSIRLTNVSVGKALSSLKYEKTRLQNGAHCYLVSKKENNIYED